MGLTMFYLLISRLIYTLGDRKSEANVHFCTICEIVFLVGGP